VIRNLLKKNTWVLENSIVSNIFNYTSLGLLAKREKLFPLISKKYISLPEVHRLKYSKNNITSSYLFDKPVQIADKNWFMHSLNEIFIDEVYKFRSISPSPLIIDCGSNIGLSIIYFKKLYPDAKIIGFEPDREIFKKLQSNINVFQLKDVELIESAVWINNTELSFHQDGSVGGHITDDSAVDTIKVQARRLKDYLHQKVDFLKIDVEGAENEIIMDCSEALENVENIFIEYHSPPDNEQKLGEILLILKAAGFRVYIKEAWENMKYPFVQKKGPFFDLQLNIFGYRPDKLND
jgi:FkbM family methyltransferase